MNNKQSYISIRGARQHNLKSIDIDVPKNSFVVITGPSGSGKSSLAFDTIYVEGQRRYIESLSSYVRSFIARYSRPDFDSISGLSPAVAIDQKVAAKSYRSTLATITGIYDYVRLMYAKIGIPYSWTTNLPISRHNNNEIEQFATQIPIDVKMRICAIITPDANGSYIEIIKAAERYGCTKVIIDGKIAPIETMASIDKNYHVIEAILSKVIVSDLNRTKILQGINNAMTLSDGIVNINIVEIPKGITVQTPNGPITKPKNITLSQKLYCADSGMIINEVEPKLFSFNSPAGACPHCKGSGIAISCNIYAVVPDQSLSILQGAIRPCWLKNHKYYLQILSSLAKHYDFPLDKPFATIPEHIKDIIFYGSKDEVIVFQLFNDFNQKTTITKKFEGIVEMLNATIGNVDPDEDDIAISDSEWQTKIKCTKCNGYRLKREALAIKVNNMNIGELCAMDVDAAIEWFRSLYNKLGESHLQIAELILKEINSQLKCLANIGLGYLTLEHPANALSGGEAQRVRLASQIGSGLSGIMYVLDEPSIGLHQSDNHKLIQTLIKLKELGNSVIVVEHDEDTMKHADYVIDIGPKAGKEGGYVMAQGTVEEVMNNPNSITGKFLSGKECIEVPTARRRYGNRQFLEIKNANYNNLKNINITIPLGMFVVVTGVSGGGKSSLVIDTMYSKLVQYLSGHHTATNDTAEILNYENIDKIIKIDQSPIGRTPRSNPATYTAIFFQIRDIFVALPESQARGYTLGRFSFNVKGGRCAHCQGNGSIKVEMHFLPDVYVECDVCHGSRYNKETLEIKYNGKSIADIMNMTVDEIMIFFKGVTAISDRIKALHDVGLGYLKIGQPSTTLSGGEAQRIKLAKELSKKSTGNTMYIMDEPTIGLHSIDTKRLIKVLCALVDKGNSLVLIEHNLDVVKTADYVIDMGPYGGKKGGYVLACGTPEEVAENENSITGPFLKELLKKK